MQCFHRLLIGHYVSLFFSQRGLDGIKLSVLLLVILALEVSTKSPVLVNDRDDEVPSRVKDIPHVDDPVFKIFQVLAAV